MKDLMAFIGIGIVVILIGFGMWKAERWFNWKVDYGGRVDDRIEQLEERIDVLEAKGGTLALDK